MDKNVNLFFNTNEVKDVEMIVNTNEDCMPLYTELNMSQDLNIVWSIIRDMDEKTFEEYAERLRIYLLNKYDNEHYGVGGGDVSLENIIDRLQKFNKLNVNNNDMIYFEDNGNQILKGYNTWSSVVDHWFPEMMEVEISEGLSGIKPSIIGVLRDKDLCMKKMKRILWKDKLNGWRDDPNKSVWPTLKQSLRMGSGTQPVTNIRGTVAKWVWENGMLSNKHLDEIVVYDPSMGWAGRLIAFLAATNNPELKNKKCVYIGTDPNSKIHSRYKMIENFWKKYIDPTCKAEVIPLCLPAEDICNDPVFKKYKGKVCIAYTSPPYFSKERYSEDAGQSFKRYGQYNLWRDGFLKGTLKNSYDLLMPGGRLFWNIGNLKISKGKFLPLEQDSVSKAIECGFTQEKTLLMLQRFVIGRDNNLEKMQEAKSMNIVNVDGKLTKYEPVFQFKK